MFVTFSFIFVSLQFATVSTKRRIDSLQSMQSAVSNETISHEIAQNVEFVSLPIFPARAYRQDPIFREVNPLSVRAQSKIGKCTRWARNISFFLARRVNRGSFKSGRRALVVSSYRCSRARYVVDARVKNDIKFESSLNKKSLSRRHAVALFIRPRTLKVKCPSRPAGFPIINFNVVPDKNVKHPPRRRR